MLRVIKTATAGLEMCPGAGEVNMQIVSSKGWSPSSKVS